MTILKRSAIHIKYYSGATNLLAKEPIIESCRNIKIVENLSESGSGNNHENTCKVESGNKLENTCKIGNPSNTNMTDSKMYKAIHTKSLHLGNSIKIFVNGPLRSNALTTFHLLKLIASEQQFVPALSTWPQAKAAYIDTFNWTRNLWLAGWFNTQNVGNAVKELTWGHLGRALRVSAEMASFYYIGQFIGMAISFPFK